MDTGNVIIIIAIGIPFLGYTILTQIRKHKYTSLASKLQAEYINTGFFEPGKITGKYLGKVFTIEPLVVGSASSGTYRTIISVKCRYNKDPLVIYRGFFKNYPDWKFVFKRGDKTEMKFFWIVNLNNTYVKIVDEEKSLLKKIFDSLSTQSQEIISLMRGGFILSRYIILEDYSVKLALGGIVQDENKIENSLTFIKKVADNIDKVV
jgi:hypothetical protein